MLVFLLMQSSLQFKLMYNLKKRILSAIYLLTSISTLTATDCEALF